MSTPEAAWPEGLIDDLDQFAIDTYGWTDARDFIIDVISEFVAWRDPKGEPAVENLIERRARLAARAEEMANDPEITASIEEFKANMAVLDAGGPEANALRQRWHDDNFDAGIRLVWRATKNEADAVKRAEAAEAERDALRAAMRETIETLYALRTIMDGTRLWPPAMSSPTRALVLIERQLNALAALAGVDHGE